MPIKTSFVPLRANSPYAPIRYEASRPYCGTLGTTGAQLLVQPGGIADYTRVVSKIVQDKFASMTHAYSHECKEIELKQLRSFGIFNICGRQIYDLDKVLVGALERTDIDLVPCGSLTLPSKSFYIHFGSGHEGCEAYEGAYILKDDTESLVFIQLISSGAFKNKQFWHYTPEAETPILMLDTEDAGRSLLAAFDQSMDDAYEMHLQISRQFDPMYRKSATYQGRVDLSLERLHFAKTSGQTRQALQLIVTSILYVMSAPEDVQDDWQSSMPSDVFASVSRAQSFNAKLRAERAVREQGYIKVRHVGRLFASSAQGVSFGQEAASGGGIKSTHIRNGHMRRQHFGRENSQVKLIWIHPVVVNEGLTPMQGRIHAYEAPDPVALPVARPGGC